MPDVYLNPPASLPEKAVPVFAHLVGEVMRLREKWLNYRFLFAHSPERIATLNKSGGAFFYFVDHLFIDDVVLTLSRLTDDAEQGKYRNLSLQYLIAPPISASYPALADRLAPSFAALQSKAKGVVREHRRKRIAHSDDQTHLSEVPVLPPLTRVVIEDVITDAVKFVEDFYEGLDGGEFRICARLERGADVLHMKLLKAQAYEELEEQGVVSWGAWRRFLEKPVTGE